MLSLIWWLLIFGAAFQAYRAWDPARAIGTIGGTYALWFFVSFLFPMVAWIGSVGVAAYIGYEAEQQIGRKQISAR